MATIQTGRVLHGGHPFFRAMAPRIEAAMSSGTLPIVTRGMLGQHPIPARYEFYNTEDLHHARKRTPAYLALLDGAERVGDYSSMNQAAYPRTQFRPIALGTVVPPRSTPRDPEIPILFFGCVTPRRAAIVDQLPVTVVDRVYDEALRDLITRSVLVLSIHAYDNRTNDSFRVFQALEMGGRVVAESSQEAWYDAAIRPHATVVPYEALVPTCRQLLS